MSAHVLDRLSAYLDDELSPEDRTLVETLFGLTCDFIARVPVFELTFKPEPAVWELIA